MIRLHLRVLRQASHEDRTTKIVHLYNGDVVGSVNIPTRSVADYLSHFNGAEIEYARATQSTPAEAYINLGELRRGGFSVL